MKTWKSKCTFKTFCKENNIDENHPYFNLFKKCYDIGELYGERIMEQTCFNDEDYQKYKNGQKYYENELE